MIGLKGNRVLKFSADFTRPLSTQREFDAQIIESKVISIEDNIGFALQERLQGFDLLDKQQTDALIQFFNDLKNGHYGETYMINDFAAGVDQFGWKRDSQNRILVRAVEQSAVISYDQLVTRGVEWKTIADRFMQIHESITDDLSNKYRNNQ